MQRRSETFEERRREGSEVGANAHHKSEYDAYDHDST